MQRSNMQGSQTTDSARRSSRVPVTVPILVTSLEPDSDFSEVCETLVVSAHGCAIHSPAKLEAGVPVQFQSKEGSWTMAHIVDCRPMNSGQTGWMLGASFDQPENFWGLETCPEDWGFSDTNSSGQPAQRVSISSRSAREKTSKQVSRDQLRAMVNELVQPLLAEVTELKEKLTRKEPKRSQLDISLSHIPPEVEEKLGIRLREELGAQVLQQTRQQSEQVLEAAKDAIGKKIREAQNEFREHVSKELQTVGQRAQSFAEEITESVQQHLDAGEEQLQQRVSEADTHLERQSEELFRALQQRLGEEHATYRREMQNVKAAVVAESSRVQAQTNELGGRVAKLDESVRSLESDLDARLSRMGSEIISNARTQLDRAVDVVLKELSTRNAKELGHQLEEACAQLNSTQKRIEASVSELLRTEVAGTLLSFGQTMEELAQDSVGRWRHALARDLTSVAKTLGGHFRLEDGAGDTENNEPQDE